MKVRLVPYQGRNQLEINGKIVDALGFKSFRPKDFNVDDFYAAGVRIFNIITTGLCSRYGMKYSLYGESWLGDGQYDFSTVDNQIDFFIEHAPEAVFILNLQLDTRPWWLEQHPGEADSFSHLSQVASHKEWRKSAADYLQALLRHTEEKYQDKICCYVLMGGNTTEWFSDYDYEAAHPTKLKAYREKLGDPELDIPPKERVEQEEEKLFLHPVEDQDVIRYRRFHNELIADTILYFADKAQEILNHQKLVGVFFGYILELTGPRLWNAGHLDIDRVYNSPDIDMIATPSSYQFRKYSDASAYMLMTGTINLHKKMYFISFDHRTYRYSTNVDGFHVTAPGVVLQNHRQIADVARREMMQRLASGAGHWWFDMFSNWFHEKEIMDDLGHIIRCSNRIQALDMQPVSEIAVILSCGAMYSVNKMCGVNTFTICNARDDLSRIGAPFDVFSIRDIPDMDWKRYKLCMFINAYSLQDDERAWIKDIVARDGRTLLWVTAADYVQKDGFSREAMEKLVGMELEKLESPETQASACDTLFGHYAHPLSPTFCVTDGEAEILGRYQQSGKSALARKQFSDYTSVFAGLGNLSHTAMRKIARDAGVHLYSEDGVPVYVNKSLWGFYWHEPRKLQVQLREAGVYEDIFTGKRYETADGHLELDTTESASIMLKKA